MFKKIKQAFDTLSDGTDNLSHLKTDTLERTRRLYDHYGFWFEFQAFSKPLGAASVEPDFDPPDFVADPTFDQQPSFQQPASTPEPSSPGSPRSPPSAYHSSSFHRQESSSPSSPDMHERFSYPFYEAREYQYMHTSSGMPAAQTRSSNILRESISTAKKIGVALWYCFVIIVSGILKLLWWKPVVQNLWKQNWC